MPVFVCPGLRSGVVFHDGNGFYYHRHRIRCKDNYLRCSVNSCKSRGIIEQAGEDRSDTNIRMTFPHNHPPDLLMAEVAALKAIILQRCRTELTPYKNIFNEEVASVDEEIGGQLSLQSLSSSMRRARSSPRPPVPSTMEEYAKLMAQPLYCRYSHTLRGEPWFLGTVSSGEGDTSAIFLSPTMRRLLITACEFHIHGSLKYVPRRPRCLQLVTVMAMLKDHAFPVAFILMTKRSVAAYVTILQRLKEEGNWGPQIITTHSDVFLTAAITEVFGSIRIHVCWFYYTQTLWRKLTTTQLVPVIKCDQLAMQCCRMAMALPLLPTDCVKNGLMIIRSYIEENIQDDVMMAMMDFIEYVNDFWIESVGPRMMCVTTLPRRASNDSEAVPCKVTASLEGAQSGIWSFTCGLQRIESEKCIMYMSITLGCRIGAAKKNNEQDRKIEHALEQLNCRQYSVQDFLSHVSELVGLLISHGGGDDDDVQKAAEAKIRENYDGENCDVSSDVTEIKEEREYDNTDDDYIDENEERVATYVIETDTPKKATSSTIASSPTVECKTELSDVTIPKIEIIEGEDADIDAKDRQLSDEVCSTILVHIMDDSSVVMHIMDDKVCTVCEKKFPANICMPCGHMCLCEDCEVTVREEENSLCPMCKTHATIHKV